MIMILVQVLSKFRDIPRERQSLYWKEASRGFANDFDRRVRGELKKLLTVNDDGTENQSSRDESGSPGFLRSDSR